MLRVDEGADAAAPLRLRDDVVDERRLARGLGAEDLDDAAAGKAPDAEREIERERAGRDRADGHRRAIVHLHDRALAELALDLAERDVECFVLVHLHRPPRRRLRCRHSARAGSPRVRLLCRTPTFEFTLTLLGQLMREPRTPPRSDVAGTDKQRRRTESEHMFPCSRAPGGVLRAPENGPP